MEHDQIENDLASPHRPVRVQAVKTLAKLNDERAFEMLLDLLKHDDFAVQITAIETLGRRRDPRALPALSQLSKKNHQQAKLRALGHIADPSALQDFMNIKMNGGQNARLKMWGFSRIVALGDPITRDEALYEMVAECGTYLHHLALIFYPPPAQLIEKAHAMLNDKSEVIRQSAAVVLLHYGDERGLALLEDAYQEILRTRPAYHTRLHAIAGALGERALDLIIEAIPHQEDRFLLSQLRNIQVRREDRFTPEQAAHLEPLTGHIRANLFKTGTNFYHYDTLKAILLPIRGEKQFAEEMLEAATEAYRETGNPNRLQLYVLSDLMRHYHVEDHPIVRQYVLPGLQQILQESKHTYGMMNVFSILGHLGTPAAAELLYGYAQGVKDAAGTQEREIADLLHAVSALGEIVPEEAMSILENFFITYKPPERPPLFDEVQPDVYRRARNIYLRLLKDTDPQTHLDFVTAALTYEKNSYSAQVGPVRLTLSPRDALPQLVKLGAPGVEQLLEAAAQKPPIEPEIIRVLSFYAKNHPQEEASVSKITDWLVSLLDDRRVLGKHGFLTAAEEAIITLRRVGTVDERIAAWMADYPAFVQQGYLP